MLPVVSGLPGWVGGLAPSREATAGRRDERRSSARRLSERSEGSRVGSYAGFKRSPFVNRERSRAAATGILATLGVKLSAHTRSSLRWDKLPGPTGVSVRYLVLDRRSIAWDAERYQSFRWRLELQQLRGRSERVPSQGWRIIADVPRHQSRANPRPNAHAGEGWSDSAGVRKQSGRCGRWHSTTARRSCLSRGTLPGQL